MADTYLRSKVVPPDGPQDVRLYPDGPDGGDVTVPVTGVSSSSFLGTLGVALAIGLSGLGATASAGSVAPTADVALVGSSVAGSVGTVAPTSAVALTGVAAVGSVGTVVDSDTDLLSSVVATGTVGTVAPGAAVALVGTSATGTPGTVAPGTSEDLSGLGAAGSVGSVVPAVSSTLVGVSAVGDVGFAVSESTVALSGLEASGAVGTVSASAPTPPEPSQDAVSLRPRYARPTAPAQVAVGLAGVVARAGLGTPRSTRLAPIAGLSATSAAQRLSVGTSQPIGLDGLEGGLGRLVSLWPTQAVDRRPVVAAVDPSPRRRRRPVVAAPSLPSTAEPERPTPSDAAAVLLALLDDEDDV